MTEQGIDAGRLACQAGGPVIAVLHDPRAGQDAIRTAGAVTLALDGHTHQQIGTVAVDAAQQFVGASTGGAPGEGTVVRTFAYD